MAPRKRVCLVTPGYISSTPRVVREADALTGAGFDVRVVFTQGQLDGVREFDDALVASKPWRASVVRWSSARANERRAYYRSGIRHRVSGALTSWGFTGTGIVERAEGRIYPELARLAAAEPADVFIGHYPTGLAAAAHSAKRHGAALGYDVEDLYADTFADSAQWAPARARIIEIERRYVPKCRHISAVSAPVAEAFAARHGTPLPVVVHNCHPWAERRDLDGRTLDRQGPELSLFWFSQTVGLDRGIQDAIRAAGRLAGRVQVHLRGSVSDDVRRELLSLAAACGVGDALHFHPRCAPAELLSRAAEHDVGLSLETDDALSRRLSATNKLFLYLTAGLAVAATDLPGQRSVLEASLEAGLLHRHGDVETLAAHFERWSQNPEMLAQAKQSALAAARLRWSAEVEGQRLAAAVSQLFGRAMPHRMASGE